MLQNQCAYSSFKKNSSLENIDAVLELFPEEVNVINNFWED